MGQAHTRILSFLEDYQSKLSHFYRLHRWQIVSHHSNKQHNILHFCDLQKYIVSTSGLCEIYVITPFKVCIIEPSVTLMTKTLNPTAATKLLPSGEKHASYTLQKNYSSIYGKISGLISHVFIIMKNYQLSPFSPVIFSVQRVEVLMA